MLIGSKDKIELIQTCIQKKTWIGNEKLLKRRIEKGSFAGFIFMNKNLIF